MREHQICHPHVHVGVAELSQREDAHAEIGRLDLDLRAWMLAHQLRHRDFGTNRGVAKQLAVAKLGVLVVEEAMQERGMHRVDADFERLQPVAVDQSLKREGVRRRRDEAVEMRKRRRFARPQIAEQDAALLDDRIGFLPDVGGEPAAFRLGRRLQALPGHVEQPAVKCTAQAAVLKPSEREIGAAVRAGALDQAVAAPLVAEHNEVLAQKPHRLERPVTRKLVDQRGRLPIPPHQRAGRRAGAGAGHQIVLLRAQHGTARQKVPGFRDLCALYHPRRDLTRIRAPREPRNLGSGHRVICHEQNQGRPPCRMKLAAKSKPRSRRGPDFSIRPSWWFWS